VARWSGFWRVLRSRLGTLALLAFAVLSVPALLLGQRAWQEKLLERAAAAADCRDFAEARTFLERYLRSQPNVYEARLLLAQVARRAGQLDEARIQLDVAETIQSGGDAVALEQVLVETQDGRLELDKDLWSLVRDNHASAVLILEALTQSYLKNHLLERMRQALDALIERQPDHGGALLQRAWFHERRLDFPAALADCQRVPPEDREHDESLVRQGQILLLMQKPQEAAAILEPLRSRLPDDVRIVLGLFQAQRKQGELERAAELDAELERRFSEELMVLLERGQFRLEQGRPADAEPLLRKAVARSPHDYRVYYALQQSLRQQGKSGPADEVLGILQKLEADNQRMKELSEQLERQPLDAEARCEIARILLRRGEEAEGLNFLNAVLRLQPRHQRAHAALAEHYEKTGQTGLAKHHRQLAGTP
jgi:tetratricopeptide (TPR) repeat protein